MGYFVRIHYRIVKDGGEIEGICELYFDSFRNADIFADAAKLSKDVEGFEILYEDSKATMHAWKK